MGESACGVDVHRDLLVAMIIDVSSRASKRFENDVDGISGLKDWLEAEGCRCVVMESSGVYWVALYLALEDTGFDVSLANARQVKAIPGRKTDQIDSEWLAQLLGSGLIRPS